jgi:Flp pilus assembly protein TadD
MVLHKRGDFDQALTMFGEAANVDPKDAQPLILRGLSLQQANRQQAAEQAYQQALKRQPNNQRAKSLLEHLNKTRL